MEYSKPSRASQLPQYFYSELMYERFLDATLIQEEEINRAINIKRQVKLTDNEEIEYDNLKYFIVNKKKFEEEFYEELLSILSKDRTNLFCSIISENWYDGRVKRESKPVMQLMASVRNYLLEYRKVKNVSGIKVIYDIEDGIEPNFEDDEIEEIIALNRRMLDGYLPNWLDGHPKKLEMGSSDIYCRRGVFLEKEFDSEEYFEWRFINSYSLAFSVTEKFAQMADTKTPAIINTNIANLRERVLFFSPFIKGMPAEQFEFGIIPHWWTMRINKQEIHGGIIEYMVD